MANVTQDVEKVLSGDEMSEVVGIGEELINAAAPNAPGTIKTPEEILEEESPSFFDMVVMAAKLEREDPPRQARLITDMAKKFTMTKAKVRQFVDEVVRSNDRAGRKETPAEPLPNEEALPASEIIDKVEAFISRYVFIKDPDIAHLIALWVFATYLHERFKVFGYLWVTSATRECGKSTLLEVLACLVFGNDLGVLLSLSEAVLFRSAEGRTLILDEVEMMSGDDKEKAQAIISVLNAGYQQGLGVPRMEKENDKWVVRTFSVYGPKVLSGIKRIADTIESRCFRIQMVPKTKDEKRSRFLVHRVGEETNTLRGNMELWAAHHGGKISELYEGLPDEIAGLEDLSDRSLVAALPLICMATAAAVEDEEDQKPAHITRLYATLKSLSARTKDDKSRDKETLSALLGIFDEVMGSTDTGFISTEDLLRKCEAHDDLRWIQSGKALATTLKKYDIFVGHDSTKKTRGYRIRRADTDELRERWLA